MNYELSFTAEVDRALSEEDLLFIGAEVLYTLHFGDFLRMPQMDFESISEIDPDIYALFN
jgi:hypothetical protein